MIENIDFQVVIASYNRKENIVKLAKSINQCTIKPRNIIVVDATNEENNELKLINNVIYIHKLKHKNQPYQRLVGTLASDSEYIIFFDDDLEILDKDIFIKLLTLLKTEGIVGVTAGIDFQDSKQSSNSFILWIKNILLFFTGRPFMPKGKIGVAGYYGALPKDRISETEILRGPLMGFRREIFLKLPKIEMLSLFDQKLLIPEDKLLSIEALKYGKLLNYPINLVRHPKIPSTYFLNHRDHTKRVHLSRYILNIELAKNKSGFKKVLFEAHFWYYSFWRKVSAIIQSIFRPKIYMEKLKGLHDADKLAIKYKMGKLLVDKNILIDAYSDAFDCK
jgi:glycosyltransferase involved in cell wall biosynthesis